MNPNDGPAFDDREARPTCGPRGKRPAWEAALERVVDGVTRRRPSRWRFLAIERSGYHCDAFRRVVRTREPMGPSAPPRPAPVVRP